MEAVAEADRASAGIRQGKQTGCGGRLLQQAGLTGRRVYECMSLFHKSIYREGVYGDVQHAQEDGRRVWYARTKRVRP